MLQYFSLSFVSFVLFSCHFMVFLLILDSSKYEYKFSLPSLVRTFLCHMYPLNNYLNFKPFSNNNRNKEIIKNVIFLEI